jgi:hypothetical protein
LVLGLVDDWLGPAPFTVPARDTLLTHLHLQGRTGSGKSTQLLNLMYQVCALPERYALCAIDTKDVMLRDFCALLPPQRVDDAILWDLADAATHPVAFNPLAAVTDATRTLAVSQLLSCFSRLFDASAWGSRIEHILRYALLGLTFVPEATVLNLYNLLTNPDWREWALGHMADPAVRGFFAHEFPNYVGTRGGTSAIQPILTKLSIITAYPPVRRTLGQRGGGVQPRQVMDEGRVLLCQFSQGVVGEDAARFLAALVVAAFHVAAQSRVDLPEAARRPAILCCDEFQTFTSSAFDAILTQGRALGLGLICANQFIEQLTPVLRLTIQKNCAYQLNCTKDSAGHHGLMLLPLREADPQAAAVVLRPLPPLPTRRPQQLATIRQRSRSFGLSVAEVDRAIDAQRDRVANPAAEPAPSSRRSRKAVSALQEEPHDLTFFER